MHLKIPNIDKRLQRRYASLVYHFSQNSSQTNSMKAPFDGNKTHSHTQALYRFLNNDNISVSELAKPIVAHALEGIQRYCSNSVLVAHDWSRLALNHKNKTDKLTMTHKADVGYELQSSLVISDSTGKPISPIAQNIMSADACLSSYTEDLNKDTHLNELTQRMLWINEQVVTHTTKSILHIIDREADSALHMRTWSDSGMFFLIRGKSGNTLTYQEQSLKTQAIADNLSYQPFKAISFKNKPAKLMVAQADVVLTREAKPKAKDSNGKRQKPRKGEPLPLRLVCTRIEDKQGKLLAQWLLLTNEHKLSMFDIAQFYYYRWQIESYFKLLKSAGHQMEKWLQQRVSAFFKRALLVSQSCVMVWKLMNDSSDNANELRQLLVRLSGRQMKRDKPYTAPALLDGYLMLLSAHELLQHLTPEQIAQAVKQCQLE